MKIQENNQHDYYAQSASIIIAVQQFASSFIKMQEAISKCMDGIKEAMLKELAKDQMKLSKKK